MNAGGGAKGIGAKDRVAVGQRYFADVGNHVHVLCQTRRIAVGDAVEIHIDHQEIGRRVADPFADTQAG